MEDLKKMTSKELEEEIFRKSAEAINELGKKRGPIKRKLKGITGLTRKLLKKTKARKGGKK